MARITPAPLGRCSANVKHPTNPNAPPTCLLPLVNDGQCIKCPVHGIRAPVPTPEEFGRSLARENHEAEKHYDPAKGYHSGGMDDGDVAGVIEARFGFNTPGDRKAQAAYDAETDRLSSLPSPSPQPTQDGPTMSPTDPKPSAPTTAAVLIDRATLERFLAAYDDLASLAGVVQCGCDPEPEGYAALPRYERTEAHRGATAADEQTIRRALGA